MGKFVTRAGFVAHELERCHLGWGVVLWYRCFIMAFFVVIVLLFRGCFGGCGLGGVGFKIEHCSGFFPKTLAICIAL